MYAVVEFEDGLSVVPYKWLTQDLKKAFWPIYTSTARYDKAVKRKEEPESTWSKCSIRKIYGTYMTYDVARQKCKRAEEESDLTSNTEKDESRKRTRKNRAKKDMNSSASSNELSDDTSILDSMPKVPKFLNKVTHLKNTGNAQKSFDDRSYKRQSTKTMKNTASNNQSNVGKNDFHPSPVVSSGYIRPGGSRNYQIEEEEQDDLVSIESTERDEDNDVVLSPSLTSKEDARDKNVSKDEESCNDDDNYNVNASVMSLAGIKKTKVLGPNYNDGERKSNDSTRYVIRKLTNMEMKMNVMHTDIKNMKKQVAKLSTGTFETKERQKIDIFQDLPLKDENDLEAMETKLKNNSSYRSEMTTQLAFVLCQNMKTSCLRLMRLMVSNDLTIKYSWYGAKKEQIFSKLEICKIITNVIRKSFVDVTDDQISAPIKIWLAYAKERMTRNKEQGQENVPLENVPLENVRS